MFPTEGVKLMEALALPDVATKLVGGAGTMITGIILLLTEDGEDVAVVLVAVTVKAYEVPFVNPDIVIGLVDPEAVNIPVVSVTLYV